MKPLFLVVSSIAVARCFSSVPRDEASGEASGCLTDEAELSNQRLQTLVALDSVISTFSASPIFSLDSFLSQLAPLFTEGIIVDIPNGVGSYVGLYDAADYLALSFSSVNVNLFLLDGTNPSDQGLSIDGDAYTLETTYPFNFFPSVTPSLEGLYPAEIVATFSPCSEKIASYRVVRNGPLDDFQRLNVWANIHSTYQGMFDVCAYHEKYCTGEHRQYESFASCFANLSALPDLPVDCPWAPLAGNAKPCKSKHKNLVPFDNNHCYHMGPLTLADGTPNYDLNGKLKCSDAEECPTQTDFVLGEPTAEFLASMNAYDAAIATEYNNPFTNFSVDHYKFPKLA